MLDDTNATGEPRGMYKIVGGDRKEYGPVTAEQIRHWLQEGRADGDTLAQAEGGIWKKLSTYPEFADLLPAATTAVPPPFAAPGMEGPQQKVQAAGTAMVALGVICLCLGAFSTLSHLFSWGPDLSGLPAGPEFNGLREFLEMMTGGFGLAIDVMMLGLSAVILLGGLKMLKLRNYGLCVAAAVIALVPCLSPCCCLGLPIGIWALVVLLKPEVKSAFV